MIRRLLDKLWTAFAWIFVGRHRTVCERCGHSLCKLCNGCHRCIRERTFPLLNGKR